MKCLVGIGNYLMRDDAIGLRIAEELELRSDDETRGFCVRSLAGGGLEVLGILEGPVAKILFVDCVRWPGGRPGEFRVFATDEVTTRKVLAGRSTHEGDLLQLLTAAGRLGLTLPPCRILGIYPCDTSAGDGLSEELSSDFEVYLAEVKAQLDDGPWCLPSPVKRTGVSGPMT